MTAQLTLDLRSLKAQRTRDLMADALAWIEDNHAAWLYFVDAVERNVWKYGTDANVKGAFAQLRYSGLAPDGQPVKLNNNWTAAFGRILREWYPHLAVAVKTRDSKTDGAVIPPKPVWA